MGQIKKIIAYYCTNRWVFNMCCDIQETTNMIECIFYLTHFKHLGEKSGKNHCFLEDIRTRKFASELSGGCVKIAQPCVLKDFLVLFRMLMILLHAYIYLNPAPIDLYLIFEKSSSSKYFELDF